jgi:ATP-dependent DNA helicase RecG
VNSTTKKSLSLDTPAQYVKGIGPKRSGLLKRAGIETAEDLLNYFPRRYLDRRNLTRIRDLKVGETVTVVGKVLSGEKRKGRSSRFVLLVEDGSGMLQCVWFRGLSYIANAFEAGETVAFSGKVTLYRGPQLVHPEYDKISEEGESNPLHTGGIVPLYPSTETFFKSGLDSRGFRRILRGLLNEIKTNIPETLSSPVIEKNQLMGLSEAYDNIHFPKNWDDLHRSQYRLKFEELFYIQLFLALQRKNREIEKKGIVFDRISEQAEQLIKKLPFELTNAQKRVIQEIQADMKSEKPMNRLLQGDVGSGKTIVALIAILIVIGNGYQTAFMAPTEILAEQHFLTFHQFLEDIGVRVALLKGGQKGSEKQEILNRLSKGEIDIVVGTHALVQEGVQFKKLGFVVIDEQHRFGVMQRAILRMKGYHPDVLVMTATPIPRTLALTLYGDLDVSILNEMPEGRKPIITAQRSEGKRGAIYEFIREEVRKGRQVYIVYPLVEESEKVDLAAATEGYETLSKGIFPEFSVALLHGRMKSEEKEAIMQEYKSGQINILVSTTVIEVGVDVPNATVMLVEHAERFGLTQLHQLRGRIGRGTEKSTCILLAQYPVSDDAKKRLKTMISTNDGFKIAEADLEIRGPGELFGTRQHGMINLKIANLVTDGPILEKARKEAFQIVLSDPKLTDQENKVLKQTYVKRYREKFGLIEVG